MRYSRRGRGAATSRCLRNNTCRNIISNELPFRRQTILYPENAPKGRIITPDPNQLIKYLREDPEIEQMLDEKWKEEKLRRLKKRLNKEIKNRGTNYYSSTGRKFTVKPIMGGLHHKRRKRTKKTKRKRR